MFSSVGDTKFHQTRQKEHQNKTDQGLVTVSVHNLEKTHRWTKWEKPYNLDVVYDLDKCGQMAVSKPHYQKIKGENIT